MSKLQKLIRDGGATFTKTTNVNGKVKTKIIDGYMFTPEQLQAIMDEVYKITKAKARMCYSANRYKTQFEILNALSKIPQPKTRIKLKT